MMQAEAEAEAEAEAQHQQHQQHQHYHLQQVPSESEFNYWNDSALEQPAPIASPASAGATTKMKRANHRPTFIEKLAMDAAAEAAAAAEDAAAAGAASASTQEEEARGPGANEV